jgi:LPS export ABC transporter protein LptC
MLFRIFTLLAVVALAVSTWILSSPAHRPTAIFSIGKIDLPGYYLKDAVLTEFDVNGAPSIRLEAERIDQVDHGTEVALSNVSVHYQSPNRQKWLMTGDTGRVEPGGNVIDIAGNVRLQGDSTEHAGTVIVHTEALTYDVPDAIATTQDDVRVDFGPQTLTAHGLKANLNERTLHLDQKVNGRFQH